MFAKSYFPTLLSNQNLAYFDSAATAQTHSSVLYAMEEYYTQYRASPGRSVHKLGDQTTNAVESAREQVAKLINVTSDHVLFTSGTTQGLNWIAEWNKHAPVVVITEAEHHANIIPWLQQGRTQENGRLRVIPIHSDGFVSVDEARQIIEDCPPGSFVSIIATSNVSGVEQPWQEIANIAKQHELDVAVDFCQTIAHTRLDLQKSNIDWAVFSAHKMYGPTGIGALYTSKDVNELNPIYFGGGTVDAVTFNSVQFMRGPERHEPGTPNVAAIIGFGAAAELLYSLDSDYIPALEHDIFQQLQDNGIFEFDCLKPVIDYQAIKTSSILSFVPVGFHSSDMGTMLSHTGVAVRTGKLCAHPYVDRLSDRGVMRVSISPYNTIEDCGILINGIKKVTQILV